jgi:hypothetical protein
MLSCEIVRNITEAQVNRTGTKEVLNIDTYRKDIKETGRDFQNKRYFNKRRTKHRHPFGR